MACSLEIGDFLAPNSISNPRSNQSIFFHVHCPVGSMALLASKIATITALSLSFMHQRDRWLAIVESKPIAAAPSTR